MSDKESERLISDDNNRVNRVEQFKNIQLEALNLFEKKNKDYGDAFAQDGAVGVLVRLGDKINRLKNITNTNITLVKTETLRDTLIDLHNYCAMTIMLLDENKPINNENNNFNLLDLDYDELHYSNQLRADDKCIIN